MTRPAPRITPSDIVAGMHCDPNGGHLFVVEVPSGVVGMRFDLNQVRQLKAAIGEFERRATVLDGGPDFHNPRFEPIEVVS